MPLMQSWVGSANNSDTPFPLNNLPYGVFSTPGSDPRCGVAIGDQILDLRAAATAGLISQRDVFDTPDWNAFMASGRTEWDALRTRLVAILSYGSPDQDRTEPLLVPISTAKLHLPITVTEYTDFYAGKNHAVNVGTMFRGAENALPPNWLHIPIGYNGRASSVVVSGTDIRRPWGQLKGPDETQPRWAPSACFDIELELGAIVGQPSSGPIGIDQADANIFGYVLLNDWSARDIQAWEYQPLGPFQAKATATTISPWIVTSAALTPFRRPAPARERPLLPHLADTSAMFYDIDLTVALQPDGGVMHTLSKTNAHELYFSAAQQLAHHTTSGCPMRVGDLLGSGTISGAHAHECGSLLEMTWNGDRPLNLGNALTRTYIEDGDTVRLRGVAQGDGYHIGFGDCSGSILPAHEDPYSAPQLHK